MSEICLLTESEYKKIIYNWNKTNRKYQENKTIHALFEEQVNIIPEVIAIKYENISLSYKQLNPKANQIANYIIKHQNIAPDSLIALFIDRSELMLTAILAVLKSGAAYVPIDVNYPDERVKYILKDIDAKTILTNGKYQLKLRKMYEDDRSDSTFTLINIENINNNNLDISSDNPLTEVTISNLAYIIYTSGTSGEPKGVMIEHKSVVNLALSHADAFGLSTSENKDCLFYANYVFDAHVSEVYSSLLFGHTLHIINDDTKQNISLLSQYISSNNIFIGTIPPALLDNQTILKLDTIIVAGEKTPQEILDKYQLNGIKIINAYGPTEATVCSSLNHYSNNGASNIGKPLPNTTSYVLSDKLVPLPPGIIGELYVGGVGLARGYLNKPELTAEKFILNPFLNEKEKSSINDRLYKTGDLVRWLSNGDLEYIGRNDSQIKINGYRIELKEIENVLLAYHGIKQCIVLLKESITKDSQTIKYITAYYTSVKELDNDAITIYLQDNLPEYMVPSVLIYLNQIPITANGKLNYPLLLSYNDSNFNSKNDYCAPRNELQKQVCQI